MARKGIVYDTMTRGIILVLLAVLAGACSPPRPDPATVARAQAEQAATAEAWRAWNAQQAVASTARWLQTNPFVDPAVRADPWPCARAVEAAGGWLAGRPMPPCYAEAIVRQRAATITVVPVFLMGR
jgi:hypothetical protein